jgi:hypothetical protein
MSLGELDIVLEEGYQEFNDNLKLHMDLKCAILNAQYSRRRGGGLYSIEDFLGSNRKHESISPEEQAQRVSEHGRALAQNCDRHRKHRK